MPMSLGTCSMNTGQAFMQALAGRLGGLLIGVALVLAAIAGAVFLFTR